MICIIFARNDVMLYKMNSSNFTQAIKFKQTFIMADTEIEKAKILIVVEIVEYVPNSVVIKTIVKKTTGNVSAVSFDSGESLIGRISPCDVFIQVIEGKAEIIIEEKPYLLLTGQSIIIPANSRNTIRANERFKMLSTYIKNAYEEEC